MLKGLFGKSGKATETPLLTTAIPPCYAQVYRADGTLPTSDFTSLVVPMFERVREAAGDAEFQVLIETISAALNRAANVRFPLGRPGTDYRRFETLYNYALMVVMATAWWMERNQLGPEALESALEACVPAQGLARLKHEPEAWQDVLAFFTGEADGGLRQVSGMPWQSAPPAPKSRASIPTGETAPKRTAGTGSERFLTPHSSQWANPLSKGWVLVDAIRDGLRDGSLPYNRKQSWVHVDREGRTFLQVPEVFQWCYERLDVDVSPKTLVNQFGRLNICTRTRKGQNLLRGGRRNQKTYQQGFVVEDPELFWDGKPPADQFYIRHLTGHGFGQSPQNPPDPTA